LLCCNLTRSRGAWDTSLLTDRDEALLFCGNTLLFGVYFYPDALSLGRIFQAHGVTTEALASDSWGLQRFPS